MKTGVPPEADPSKDGAAREPEPPLPASTSGGDLHTAPEPAADAPPEARDHTHAPLADSHRRPTSDRLPAWKRPKHLAMPRRADVKAILLDLDGTLLDKTSKVSPRNRAAVQAARDAGIEVLLSTGRSVAATRETYRTLSLESPACCYNGAVIWCGASDRWLSHKSLEDDATAALIDFCDERGLFHIVFKDDWKHTAKPMTEVQRKLLGLFENVRILEAGLVPRAGVTKVAFAGEPEDVAAFESRFAGRPLYEERFEVRALPGFEAQSLVVIDLLSATCRGKAEAIHWLHDTRGFDAREVVAIGDHRNDLPMLRAAGTGVAMGNAPFEIRAEADLVIGRHDADGVAEFIEKLLAG